MKFPMDLDYKILFDERQRVKQFVNSSFQHHKIISQSVIDAAVAYRTALENRMAGIKAANLRAESSKRLSGNDNTPEDRN